MTYLIYVGIKKSSGARLKPEEISELIERHRTATEGVVIKATDEVLDGGFEVYSYDDTVEGILKRFGKSEPYPATARDLAKQARWIKDGARFSQDSSITKGEKPYKRKI